MANIFTGKIAETDYENLATATGLTFTTDTKYLVEVRGGMLIAREGTVGKGFIIEDGQRFDFTYKGTPIYIKTNSDGVVLNIAD